ncbi:MAG: NHL repeat-containing protein [Capsulimonadaceae bacterium]
MCHDDRRNLATGLVSVIRRRCALIPLVVCLAGLPVHAGPLNGPTGTTTGEFTLAYVVTRASGANRFEEPCAVQLDERAGLVYVADQKAGTVTAFNRVGNERFQYGAEQGLVRPIGLAVSENGDVYVSDDDTGSVSIITPHGDVSKLNFPSQGDTPAKPGRMTFDREGNLYVIDRATGQIDVFDKQQKLKLTFGGIGNQHGMFKDPQDVAVDWQGRIYVVDSASVPIQVFDRNGSYMNSFGDAEADDQYLTYPTAVFVDRNSQIWVVDRGLDCLKVFDRTGTLLRTFGSYGQQEGSFFHPVDVACDSFGRVYVAEIGAQRVQAFTLSRPFEPFDMSAL